MIPEYFRKKYFLFGFGEFQESIYFDFWKIYEKFVGIFQIMVGGRNKIFIIYSSTFETDAKEEEKEKNLLKNFRK